MEGFLGIRLGNLDTVGTTVNVGAVLPQRQIRIFHKKVHTGQETLVTNLFKRTPVIGVRGKGPNLFIGFGTPRSIFGIMEVQTP